jgi:hypothetical protein
MPAPKPTYNYLPTVYGTFDDYQNPTATLTYSAQTLGDLTAWNGLTHTVLWEPFYGITSPVSTVSWVPGKPKIPSFNANLLTVSAASPKTARTPIAQHLDLVSTGIKTAAHVVSAAVGVSPENYWKVRDLGDTYTTVPFYGKISSPVAMVDFRAPAGYIGTGILPIPRLDGASAAIRGALFSKAGAYAAASATVGAYILFGRNAIGKLGKGWGDHGSNYAPRLDFTARSNVNKTWSGGKWERTSLLSRAGFLEKLTPFRGDKVSVIDFHSKEDGGKLTNAYRWKPVGVLGAFLDKAGLTSDFIKFYFTGPSIRHGDTNVSDDIIVFRASINSLQESYTANWNPVQMIGRADPNYHYSSFNRDLSIDFTVYATDRDEMKPIYRKLNAIAGYMAPSYNTDTIGLTGPWMRMTIGDLFVQQPVIMTSLNYNLSDSDTTWEMNIEQDKEMMQAPHRVNVSMGLTVIGDWVPQKGGRFYSLSTDAPTAAGDQTDWMSGFKFDVDREKSKNDTDKPVGPWAR